MSVKILNIILFALMVGLFMAIMCVAIMEDVDDGDL